MKWIAAHKVMFMVGLVLAGGVAWYLHRQNTSGGSIPNSENPDYGGVATSPYNDSAAPQFSFDLGSLLGGQPDVPAGSAATPPAAGGPVPIGTGGNPADGGGGGTAGTGGGGVGGIPGGSPSGEGIVYPISNPAVSLPFGSAPAPYVPRLGAFVAS